MSRPARRDIEPGSSIVVAGESLVEVIARPDGAVFSGPTLLVRHSGQISLSSCVIAREAGALNERVSMTYKRWLDERLEQGSSRFDCTKFG